MLYEVKSTLVCNYSVLPTTSPDLTRRPWGSEASLSSLENVVSFVPRSAQLDYTDRERETCPALTTTADTFIFYLILFIFIKYKIL